MKASPYLGGRVGLGEGRLSGFLTRIPSKQGFTEPKINEKILKNVSSVTQVKT